MRFLYNTVILPIFTYACAAWFVWYFEDTHLPGGRTQQTVKRLPTMQNDCLRHLGGAVKNTSTALLHKEMVIEDIDVTLQHFAQAERARSINLPI